MLLLQCAVFNNQRHQVFFSKFQFFDIALFLIHMIFKAKPWHVFY